MSEINGNSQKAMRLSDLIPTNWLDPLLTGPNAALPGAGDPIEPKHIEVLLRRLKQRVQEAEELFGPAERDAVLEEAAAHLDAMYPTNGAPATYVRALKNAAPRSAGADDVPEGWKLVCEKCGADRYGPCGWPANCEARQAATDCDGGKNG